MAQPINTSPPALNAMPPDELRAWLARAHGFSLQDLQANREGRLSPAQKSLRINSGLVFLGVIVIVCVASACLVGFPLAMSLRGQEFSRSTNALFRLVVVVSPFVPILILGPFLGPPGVRNLLDGANGRAEAVEGVVQTSTTRVWTQRGGTMSTIWYTVNGKKLEIPFNASRQVAGLDGVRCRVYYAPRTKLVLSVEPA